MEVKEEGGSFPSNYVTIHDLKQRWLQQQQEQILKKSKNELNPKPTTPPRNHHRHRSRKSPPPPHVHNNLQIKPPVHDDCEKNLATKPMSDQNPSQQPVEKHQTRNQKPKHKTTPSPPPHNDDDAPRHRSRNQNSKHKLSASPVKQQHQPQLHSRNQNPKHNHHAAPLEQQHQPVQSRPPFDAAAAVKVSHTKEGYGRFQGASTNRYPKPPSWGKKPQISQVWVKKGESAPN